eukprot:tig00001007_g6247.t1
MGVLESGPAALQATPLEAIEEEAARKGDAAQRDRTRLRREQRRAFRSELLPDLFRPLTPTAIRGWFLANGPAARRLLFLRAPTSTGKSQAISGLMWAMRENPRAYGVEEDFRALHLAAGRMHPNEIKSDERYTRKRVRTDDGDGPTAIPPGLAAGPCAPSGTPRIRDRAGVRPTRASSTLLEGERQERARETLEWLLATATILVCSDADLCQPHVDYLVKAFASSPQPSSGPQPDSKRRAILFPYAYGPILAAALLRSGQRVVLSSDNRAALRDQGLVEADPSCGAGIQRSSWGPCRISRVQLVPSQGTNLDWRTRIYDYVLVMWQGKTYDVTARPRRWPACATFAARISSSASAMTRATGSCGLHRALQVSLAATLAEILDDFRAMGFVNGLELAGAVLTGPQWKEVANQLKGVQARRRRSCWGDRARDAHGARRLPPRRLRAARPLGVPLGAHGRAVCVTTYDMLAVQRAICARRHRLEACAVGPGDAADSVSLAPNKLWRRAGRIINPLHEDAHHAVRSAIRYIATLAEASGVRLLETVLSSCDRGLFGRLFDPKLPPAQLEAIAALLVGEAPLFGPACDARRRIVIGARYLAEGLPDGHPEVRAYCEVGLPRGAKVPSLEDKIRGYVVDLAKGAAAKMGLRLGAIAKDGRTVRRKAKGAGAAAGAGSGGGAGDGPQRTTQRAAEANRTPAGWTLPVTMALPPPTPGAGAGAGDRDDACDSDDESEVDPGPEVEIANDEDDGQDGGSRATKKDTWRETRTALRRTRCGPGFRGGQLALQLESRDARGVAGGAARMEIGDAAGSKGLGAVPEGDANRLAEALRALRGNEAALCEAARRAHGALLDAISTHAADADRRHAETSPAVSTQAMRSLLAALSGRAHQVLEHPSAGESDVAWFLRRLADAARERAAPPRMLRHGGREYAFFEVGSIFVGPYARLPSSGEPVIRRGKGNGLRVVADWVAGRSLPEMQLVDRDRLQLSKDRGPKYDIRWHVGVKARGCRATLCCAGRRRFL